MKHLLILLLLLSSLSGLAQINKIDHLLISSPESKKLFAIFTHDFRLPVVWPFETWGSFSSGSVSLGNVVLEFVNDAPDQQLVYHGIALEPAQTAAEAGLMLDSAQIVHGPANNFPLMLGEGKKDQGWTTMDLKQMLPESVNLFICDYHDRERTKNLQAGATAQLNADGGGLLGIEYLKEVIIGTPEPERYLEELSKIPGIKAEVDHFTFSEGPTIKLIRSDVPYVGLSIKVKSVEAAKQQLSGLGYTTRKTDKELILEDEIFGTRLVFFD